MLAQISTQGIYLSTCGLGAMRAFDNLHSVLLKNRHEKLGEFIVRFQAKIFLVIPAGFLRVEAGAGLDDAVKGECLDELVHREDLTVVARVPAKEGEQIDERLREVTVLSIASGDLSLVVLPFEGEDRESELVTVTFAELAFSVRLQEQRQMGEAKPCRAYSGAAGTEAIPLHG